MPHRLTLRHAAGGALLSLLLTACGAAPPPAPPAPEAPPPTPMHVTASELLGCEVKGTWAEGDVGKYTIPFSPCWQNKYVPYISENVRYFSLTALAKDFDLSSLGAIEAQNHYRDQMRANPEGDRAAAFAEAIKRAKAGEHESGVDAAVMEKAKFIVVFDLDETLYDQYGASEDCHDVSYTYQKDGETKTKYIYMVPGWQETIEAIRGAGGAVVLFSANVDDLTLTNLENIQLRGQPITPAHPLIDGIMSNSFLSQQMDTEPEGKPYKKPVAEPSKDLRHFDPKLEKVIIVDDNPTRLFQFQNTRVFHKFKAQKMCKAVDATLKSAYEGMMGVVQAEILDAAKWMGDGEGRTFALGYLPYSQLGRVAVDFLMETKGLDRAQAIDYVRNNPGVVSPKF